MWALILLLDFEEEVLMEERLKVKEVFLKINLKVKLLLQNVEISPSLSKAEAPR